jgi:SOS-response transcriptional repressor LexA
VPLRRHAACVENGYQNVNQSQDNFFFADLIKASLLFSWLRRCAALLYFRGMRNVATLYAAPDKPSPLTRPLFLSLVVAGFPSPADDYLDRDLDLHELLIQHPAATYYVRLSGDSMKGAGLYDGDILVVDRSLDNPRHNILALGHIW